MLLRSTNQGRTQHIAVSKPGKSVKPKTKTALPASASSFRNSTPSNSLHKNDITQRVSLSAQTKKLPSTPPNRTSLASTKQSHTITELRKLNEVLIKRVSKLEQEIDQLKKRTDSQNIERVQLDLDVSEIDLSNSPPAHPTSLADVQPPPNLMDVSLDSTFTLTCDQATSSAPRPPPPHISLDVKPRLLVLSDSMGRDFRDTLSDLLPEYSVFGSVYPGGTLEKALSSLPTLTETFTKSDFVFVLAGVNNIPNLDPILLENSFNKYKEIFQKTTCIFSSIPFAFHKPELNSNIFATNLNILKLSSTFNFYVFECNTFLSRVMYTKHGLHFNNYGKSIF